MGKKKILIVTPRYLYPVVGGDRLRIFNICKVLAEKYDLTLLSLCDKGEYLNDRSCCNDVFRSIEKIYHPKWLSVLNTILSLPTKKPLQLAYFSSRKLRRRVKELAESHDAIFSHLIRAGDQLKDIDCPKFLEMTDAISLNYQRVKNQKKNFFDIRSLIFAFEANRLNKYEKKIVDFFDASFLVSKIDKDFLFPNNDISSEKVIVASNGVDFNRLPYEFSYNGKDIVFIGNMLSLQNLDAAIFAAAEILPIVRSKFKDSKLRIIGRIGDSERRILENYSGVKILGEVDSIADAARGGAVGICPVRLAAGVQNKVLEYMALGLPTVSTSCGLEGFYAKNGVDLIVANSAEEIANSIIMLIKDREFSEKISISARKYVEDNHSWNFMLDPILKVIEKNIPPESE